MNMKKIFGLLIGLLCAVGTTQADNVTLGRTIEFDATKTDFTLVSATNATTTQKDGTGKTDKSGKDVYYKGTSAKMKYCYRNNNGSTVTAYNENVYAGFQTTITEGYKFDLKNITAKVAIGYNFSYRIEVLDKTGKAAYTSTDYTISNYKDAKGVNEDVSITLENAITLTDNFDVRLYYWTEGTTSSKYIVPLELTVSGDLTKVIDNQLAKPSIAYTEDGLVTITSNDERATKLYYTTDGTDPSATNGTLYAAPFSAPGKTVKVIATGDGYVNSDIVSTAVPKKVTATETSITKVTIDGESLTAADLATLKEAHALTLTKKYAVAPAVAFSYKTTTAYNDGSKDESEETTVNATVTEAADNFVATATVSNVEYTINMPVDKAATISADTESFSLTACRADQGKKDIKFKAVNTSGVVKVTLPEIKGLSWGMTKQVTETDAEGKKTTKSVTVYNGDAVAEDEEITLTVVYRADVVVEKTSATLNIAVGETTLDIPFTYEDTEAILKGIENVTGDMIWDFTTAGTSDITSDRPTELVSFKNKTGFSESFKYEYLEAAAPYFYRNSNKCYQGSDLHFITTVPGTITVEFSNTGSNPARTAKINEYLDETKTSEGGKTKNTVECHVSAGDVHIYGYETAAQNVNYLRIYNITFTADKTADIAVGDLQTTTYSNTKAWQVPAGVEVYTATYTAGKVTLHKVEESVVPANTGVIVYAPKGTYTANLTTTETTELANNDLKQTATEAVTATGTQYALVREKDAAGAYTGKACFGKMSVGQTIAQNKAYLEITDQSAAKTLSIGFEETDGISAATAAEKAQKGDCYTLDGKHMAKPVKGIYIMNGKKFTAK